ncbi:MAG: YbaB/EbfC family nucleoid-associated protein [Acidobacteria bacterium]|nr:MAG: YbaB/EbfC family nucleoid-associated protein [Acidobacteriota bacterium]
MAAAPGRARGGVSMAMSMGKMAKMLQKAQQAQQQVQQEIAAMQREGTAGGGVVKAVVDGHKNLLALTIAPEVLEDADAEMLADLVVAAVSDAQRQIDREVERKMSSLAGMLGLPPGLGG